MSLVTAELELDSRFPDFHLHHCASWPRYLKFSYQLDSQRVTRKTGKPPKIPMKVPLVLVLSGSFIRITHCAFQDTCSRSQWQTVNDTLACVLLL